MAKINDPDSLNQGTEVSILSGTKKIRLLEAGNLSTDGVTGQAIYSFLKEEWKNDTNLIKFPFPMISITEEKFDMVEGWDWFDNDTKNLIRDAGWSLRDANNNSQEEYVCVATLGTFENSVNDNAYYQQSQFLLPTDFVLSGPVNQAVKIFGDASHGNINRRGFLKIFLREQGKTYDASGIEDIGVTTMDYKRFAFPLANDIDLKISTQDSIISGTQPWQSMSIHYLTGSGFGTWANTTLYNSWSVAQSGGFWYRTNSGGTSNGSSLLSDTGVSWASYPGERLIGSTRKAFNIILSGNNGSKTQIYEFSQYKLRQLSNINESGEWLTPFTGATANVLMEFVGDQLITNQGVYIENFNATDTNAITFTDVSGNTHNFPFVAAGTINFNANLQTDTDARYWMFFSSTNAGNFGTQNAVLVENNNGFPITGAINGSGSIVFDFDYDNNSQGGRTPGTDADVFVVAIGLSFGSYVQTQGTIQRISNNSFTLVSSLERNYNNP